jgi:hypothetical protein
MNPRVQEHREQMERFRQMKAYYASIRRPWLEWVTFLWALAAATLYAGACLRWWLPGRGIPVFLCYGAAVILFIGIDSIFAPAHDPVRMPLGGFNPSRMYEKFVMQERAWQLIVVLLIPATARLIAAFQFHPQ